MHHIKQWLLSGAAVLLIIAGLALGLALLANSPLTGDLLRPALLGAGTVVVILLMFLQLGQPATGNATGRASRQPRRRIRYGRRQVRLARLQFKLDDPKDPRSFQQFLKQPLSLMDGFQPQKGYRTPLQVIETELLGYVRQLEHTHRGRIAVDIRLKQNSLTIALTFLTAYEYLAQYHDFVESIRLIRRQIQELAQHTKRWYYQATGQKLAVQAHLAMDARTPASPPARQARTAAYASRFERIAPAAAHSEVRVNIYGFSAPALLLTCLGVLLTCILFAGLAAILSCSLLGDNQDVCGQMRQELAAWLAWLLNRNGNDLYSPF